MTDHEIEDRRVRRTRRAVFDAFRDLVLTRRYNDIRVADIIAGANVGRSTFYDHFKSKDDVLLTSIEPLFEILADAAAGNGSRERIFFVLSHFWDQRAMARIIFGGELYFKLSQKLAELIEPRLGADNNIPKRLLAIQYSSQYLAVIKAWLAGKFSYTADEFAGYLATLNQHPPSGEQAPPPGIRSSE